MARAVTRLATRIPNPPSKNEVCSPFVPARSCLFAAEDWRYRGWDERASSAPFLICPSGCSATPVSSPSRKNIPVLSLPKSLLYPPPFRPTEGRHAIVTAAGRDAVDADSAADERR